MKVSNVIAIGALALVAQACQHDNAGLGDDALARVGDRILTCDEVMRSMPVGLGGSDSLSYIKAYVRQWIDTRLVSDVASKNVADMREIDRMVEEYRNELIIWEYRKRMFAEHKSEAVPEDSLAAYYERHKDEYRLEAPLLKGIFVALPRGSKYMAEVRRRIVSDDSSDFDRLERMSIDEELRDEMKYEYFRDTWTDWNRISAWFPPSGRPKAPRLSPNRPMEVTAGDRVYLLFVSELVKPGETLPLEIVRDRVTEHLVNEGRVDYDRRLKLELYQKALADGLIEYNDAVRPEE